MTLAAVSRVAVWKCRRCCNRFCFQAATVDLHGGQALPQLPEFQGRFRLVGLESMVWGLELRMGVKLDLHEASNASETLDINQSFSLSAAASGHMPSA